MINKIKSDLEEIRSELKSEKNETTTKKLKREAYILHIILWRHFDGKSIKDILSGLKEEGFEKHDPSTVSKYSKLFESYKTFGRAAFKQGRPEKFTLEEKLQIQQLVYGYYSVNPWQKIEFIHKLVTHDLGIQVNIKKFRELTREHLENIPSGSHAQWKPKKSSIILYELNQCPICEKCFKVKVLLALSGKSDHYSTLLSIREYLSDKKYRSHLYFPPDHLFFPDIERAVQKILSNLNNQKDVRHREAFFLLSLWLGWTEYPKINLAGVNLRKVILDGLNLEEAKLQDAKLEGASLRYVNLSHANLEGANLKGAFLQGIDLPGANTNIESEEEEFESYRSYIDSKTYKCTILDDANLMGANLKKAVMTGTRLCGAKLKSANLIEAKVDHCDLVNADLRRSKIAYAKSLLESDLQDAFLTERDFEELDNNAKNNPYLKYKGHPKIQSLDQECDEASSEFDEWLS